jgi:hypothetical protein
MDLQYITRQANEEMSNYEGDENRGREYTGYTGYKDDFVDFDGKGLSFASSIAANRVYTVTISNTTGANQTVLLCPSYVPSSANVVADGVIGGVANFIGSGSPKTIANFLAWVNVNPTHVVAMRIQSTLAAQLQQTMTFTRKSPFKDLETDLINLGSFVNEANNNDKLVTINRPFQMDNQTEISVPIPSTAVTTFTFFCGAVLNTAAALNNKFSKAAQTAAGV